MPAPAYVQSWGILRGGTVLIGRKEKKRARPYYRAVAASSLTFLTAATVAVSKSTGGYCCGRTLDVSEHRVVPAAAVHHARSSRSTGRYSAGPAATIPPG